MYIGARGDKLSDIPAKHQNIDKVYSVRAGKFRRYHGETWRLFFDMPTLIKNIRDFFWLIIGSWQSYWLLKRLKPDVIFTPGGFVGVPVGFAASRLNIPFITHDLDALPGLANRINARWAAVHAVAFPTETYNYPQDKTFYVGVPVGDKYKPVTTLLQQTYRQELGVAHSAQVLCVTGGGLGADRLNKVIAKHMPLLLKKYPNLIVFHIAGRNNAIVLDEYYDQQLDTELRQKVRVMGFVDDLYRYSGAATVVVARAGATNLAEFAIQHRPCIIVPNPVLTGGHQLINAQQYERAGAVVVVKESDMEVKLLPTVYELLDSHEKREALGKAISKFAKPDATNQLAKLILDMVS